MIKLILKIADMQFIKYGIVGVLSAIVDYGLLYFSYTLIGINSTLSVSIGFWGGAIFNFLMHRFYTFSETKESGHTKTLVKYALLVLGSYFITLYLISLLMQYGINIYLSKAIVLVLVYIYGFFIGKYFVFK